MNGKKRRMALLCAALGILTLCGCAGRAAGRFDASTEGIVDVETEAEGEEGTRHWYTLAGGGRIQDTEPFEPEDMTVYDARNCVESYIDREQNKILNRLVSTTLLDAAGRELEADGMTERVLRRVAELEHDLIVVEILDTSSGTFVHVGLNVNLWSPHTLYYYNEEADRLVELHTWDDERVTGLRVRNPDLLKNGES